MKWIGEKFFDFALAIAVCVICYAAGYFTAALFFGGALK